jgi:hypothetical protein
MSFRGPIYATTTLPVSELGNEEKLSARTYWLETGRFGDPSVHRSGSELLGDARIGAGGPPRLNAVTSPAQGCGSISAGLVQDIHVERIEEREVKTVANDGVLAARAAPASELLIGHVGAPPNCCQLLDDKRVEAVT